MSNYLAVATVTAAFGRMIGEALARVDRPSAKPRVRFGPPQPDPKFVGCSLFLYGVAPNAVRRNEVLPAPTAARSALDRSRAVLDLNYLLTFAGDEKTLEPQRFLGAVVSALQAQPVLPRDAITQVIESLDYLRGSDLDQAPDDIRLAQAPLDLAVLAELWESVSPARYRLAIAYTATAVTIEAQGNSVIGN
ncbi:MAG: DUF4255 domain-containing protein [Candidatus Eremiobacteraeota bacterium]|nr:DUF4255 domain-containing protein [Candidatus Eremiobacteraeota bacterium]